MYRHRRQCCRKWRTFRRSNFATVTIGHPTADSTACAHTPLTFHSMLSLRSFSSMKVTCSSAEKHFFSDSILNLWFITLSLSHTYSSTDKFEPSIPFARDGIPRDWYGSIARREYQEDQFEACTGMGSQRSIASTVWKTSVERHDRRAKQWLRCSAIPCR